MSLADDLRERARIRRKATCRGADDRLANQLEAAANAIESRDRTIRKLKRSLEIEARGRTAWEFAARSEGKSP